MMMAYLTESINMQYELHVFLTVITKYATFTIIGLLSIFSSCTRYWKPNTGRRTETTPMSDFPEDSARILGFISAPLTLAEKGHTFWSRVYWRDVFSPFKLMISIWEWEWIWGKLLISLNTKNARYWKKFKKGSSDRLTMLEGFRKLM